MYLNLLDLLLLLYIAFIVAVYHCVWDSFIHYGDLYSAPSRLLLRSSPDPCTVKKKSFETRVVFTSSGVLRCTLGSQKRSWKAGKEEAINDSLRTSEYS